LQFAACAYKEYAEEKSFRVYVTDALRIVGENTARIGGGSSIKTRWEDIVDPLWRKTTQADTRSAEEIVADVAERAGLIITHEHI
jgi:hypothetical protein